MMDALKAGLSAAGQNLDAAVGAVDCITTEPQQFSLPPCGFPEPDALDTPFYLEFPAFTHLVVAQPTKTGFIFVLDRDTGEP